MAGASPAIERLARATFITPKASCFWYHAKASEMRRYWNQCGLYFFPGSWNQFFKTPAQALTIPLCGACVLFYFFIDASRDFNHYRTCGRVIFSRSNTTNQTQTHKHTKITQMKNTIKLIAAGAIALTAISAAQAQNTTVTLLPGEVHPGEIASGKVGSKTFSGSMKVTPGKYIQVSANNINVSATFNPVTIAGTVITQNGVSSSVSEKITNKKILENIYGSASAAKGAKLMWVITNDDQFVKGELYGVKIVGGTYTGTLAPDTVFDGASLGANLVVVKNSTKTSKGITTSTSTYSAGVGYVDLLDIYGCSGVGTITETDISGGTPELKVSVTLPLSGSQIE